MKRILAYAAVAVVLVIGSFADAATIPLTAFIDGDQVVSGGPPALTPTGSSAKGVGVFEFDTDTSMLSYEILFTEVLLDGTETAAHIHGPAAAGDAADVLITLPLGDFKSGTVDISSIAGASASDLLSDLWYVNIHSTAFPEGEIRGQIIGVPEPATVGMALLAAIGFAAACRRRR